MKNNKKIMLPIAVILITMAVLISGCVDNKDDNIKPTPTSTPVPTINERAQKVIDLAKEDLAKTLSTSVDNIKLSNIEEVTWNDSSLGYPKPDEQYLQVLTPGFKIFLSYNDIIYEYHGDDKGTIIPPPEGKKPGQ